MIKKYRKIALIEAMQSGALGVLEELEDEIKEFEDKEINNGI